MHDQRTIFSVGHPPQPATISFLAPSEDEQRTISQGRIKTMSVISAMLDPLKSIIPGRIGRYTDEFYPTAAGDNFQKMGYSTVLVESGHYPGDYDRNIARKMTFLSLVAGLHQLASKEEIDHKAYFDIPNNEKLYLDVIIKNVSIAENKGDLGIFYKEELRNGEVCFRPTIEKHEDLSQFSADRVMEGGHLVFKTVESAQKWLYFEFN